MKEVMAIIRMNRMNETREALAGIGMGSFTARKVQGRGKGMVDFSILRGAQDGIEEAISQLGQGQRLIPKRLLTLIVPDKKVDLVVKTIISVNQTGKAGDGKIFIMPVTESIRVRTGETGENTLDVG